MTTPEGSIRNIALFDAVQNNPEAARLASLARRDFVVVDAPAEEAPPAPHDAAHWRAVGRTAAQMWERPAPPIWSPLGRSGTRFASLPKAPVQKPSQPLLPVTIRHDGAEKKDFRY